MTAIKEEGVCMAGARVGNLLTCTGCGFTGRDHFVLLLVGDRFAYSTQSWQNANATFFQDEDGVFCPLPFKSK